MQLIYYKFGAQIRLSGGHAQLKDAVNNFLLLLKPIQLQDLTSAAVPDANGVLAFASEINSVKAKSGARRLGERFLPLLQLVHQFSSVVEVYIQGNPTSVAPLI